MAVYIANLSVDTGVDFQHGFSLGDNDTGTFLNLTNYTNEKVGGEYYCRIIRVHSYRSRSGSNSDLSGFDTDS